MEQFNFPPSHIRLAGHKCPGCGKGIIQALARAGRTSYYRGVDNLPIPADLPLATCDNFDCGEEWIDRQDASALDAALEIEYNKWMAENRCFVIKKN